MFAPALRWRLGKVGVAPRCIPVSGFAAYAAPPDKPPKSGLRKKRTTGRDVLPEAHLAYAQEAQG